ncbi:MAG TPA: DUF4388 domain-containing protein [Acidimicrobiales bacterium]|nr:DUF4388 domain-containing protein [Acidimicrobiales bacterium]
MLQGSFDTFDFAEVLGVLSQKRQTGKLRLHSGPASVDLYMAEGRLVHAESVDHGSPPRVAATRSRLEEACFEVLRWDHGSFEFHPGASPQSPRGLDASVESVLEGARRRLEVWERVESIIPSMDVQPRLARELLSQEVVIDQQSWRVLAAIDGRRTVGALARVLSVSAFELCQLLSRMVNDGLIEVNHRPKVAIAPPVAAARKGNRTTVRVDSSSMGAGADGGPDAAAPDADAESDTDADADEEQGDKVKASSAMRVASRFRLRPIGG